MASTTSFRAYGDKHTAEGLRYLGERLLERVRQEASWNKIPHLKRSFIIQPFAMSPMGAEVVVSCCYGVDNIHVFVPFAPVVAPLVEPETEKKVYLHLKIFPVLETSRKGYSLVWDLEDDGFPAMDFQISEIMETDSIEKFLSKTTKDSKHVYPISENEDDEFNDIFRENVFDVYDNDLLEYNKIAVIEDLAEILDGFYPHGQSFTAAPSLSAETTSTTHTVISDPYPFPTPNVPTGPYPAFVSDHEVSDWDAYSDTTTASGSSNSYTQNDNNQGRVVDGEQAIVQRSKTIPGRMSVHALHTQAKITPDVWYPQYSNWNTSIVDGLYIGGTITNFLSEQEEAYLLECSNYNHLIRFFFDGGFYARWYFEDLFDEWDKLPILPSIAIRARNSSINRTMYFHCKTTYGEEFIEDMNVPETDTAGLATYWSVYDPGNIASHFQEPFIFARIGNQQGSYDYESSGEFELFTPIGSIGKLNCKKTITYQHTYDPYGDYNYDEDTQGSITVTQEDAEEDFFYGRPNYLAEFGGLAQAHIYTYDYSNIHISYEAGKTYGVWEPGDPSSRDLRDLLVGSAFGMNPAGDPRELKRSEKLELAVKQLFAIYYEQNQLNDTLIDEDYKVQLELRTCTLKKPEI